MDTAEWLHGLGLDQYLPAFRANDIDGEVLRRLTAEDLRELGIASISRRHRLLDATAALHPYPDPPPPSGGGKLQSANPGSPGQNRAPRQ
jgi:hypothetical protein